MTLYQKLILSINKKQKLLAVLIDPEKFDLKEAAFFFNKVHQSIATHVFVGGSTDTNKRIEKVVISVKNATHLPVLLFPGDIQQITAKADGILYLSLLSGRNPKYLIEQHVQSATALKKSNLEIISVGYLLIDGGKKTDTQRVSNTIPIAQNKVNLIVSTSLAGEFLGKKIIYLEAGSGAKHHVKPEVINAVKKEISIPLIVGGGIKSKKQLEEVYKAGADLVVIGTAFEKNKQFFNELKKK